MIKNQTRPIPDARSVYPLQFSKKRAPATCRINGLKLPIRSDGQWVKQ